MSSSSNLNIGKRIDAVVKGLETLAARGAVDDTILQDLLGPFQELKASVEQVSIGFIGPSGSGKSTLLNRIVGCEVVPASATGVSCTNTVLKLCKQADLNDKFKVTVHYFSKTEMETMLQIPRAPQEEDEDEKTIPELEMANEILQYWGVDTDSFGKHASVLDMIPEECHDDFNKQRLVKEFDDEDDVKEYVGELGNHKVQRYLIKEIEIRGNFSTIDEQICLLDIPGSGDTMFLNQLQRQGLNRSHLVVFTQSQDRNANQDTFKNIEKHAHAFQKKIGFAVCLTKCGQGFDEAESEWEKPKKRAKLVADAGLPDKVEFSEWFVIQQKSQFRNKLKEYSQSLFIKLQGAEIFLLETGKKTQDEPPFSKDERVLFGQFLQKIVHKSETWSLINGNVEATITDAKWRLQNPAKVELTSNCVEEIQENLCRALRTRPEFMITDSQLVDMPRSAKTSHKYFNNTIRSNEHDAQVKTTPPIPIWDHVVGLCIESESIKRSLLEFREEQHSLLAEKLSELKRLLAKHGLSEAQANICYYRLRTFLSTRVQADYKTSEDTYNNLEGDLARHFWSKVPVVVRGKGMVKVNFVHISEFLKVQFPHMRMFIAEKLCKGFRTLSDSIYFAINDLCDCATWLNTALQHGNTENVQLILDVLDGKEIPNDDDDDDEASLAGAKDPQKAGQYKTLKMEQRRNFDAELSVLCEGYCTPLQGNKFRTHKPVGTANKKGWFYVALDANNRPNLVNINHTSSIGKKPTGHISYCEQSWNSCLCFRVMEHLFTKHKRESKWYTADKDIVVKVAKLAHEYVDGLAAIWEIPTQ